MKNVINFNKKDDLDSLSKDLFKTSIKGYLSAGLAIGGFLAFAAINLYIVLQIYTSVFYIFGLKN